jgi:hypothetical protein
MLRTSDIFWIRGWRTREPDEIFLRRLGIAAGLALAAEMAAEWRVRTAFSRLVQGDVQILLAGSPAGDPTLVSDAMLDGLPEPCSGICDTPGLSASVCSHSPVQPAAKDAPGEWATVDPYEGRAVVHRATTGFIWYGTPHIGPIPIVRARDMYRTGERRMLIKARHGDRPDRQRDRPR